MIWRIDAVRFGLAGGIFAGVMIFIWTLIAESTGFGVEILILYKNILPGYDIGVFGSLVGGVYGFIIGFIKLFILAFIYNMLGPGAEK